MSHAIKSAYYQALKSAGVTFSRRYQQYKTQELREAYTAMFGGLHPDDDEVDEANPTGPVAGPTPVASPAPAAAAPVRPAPQQKPQAAAVAPASQPRAQSLQPMAAVTSGLDVIRVDEAGRQWLQEEVRQPYGPAPRARVKRTYIDSGVETVKTQEGEFTETYEVPGSGRQQAEVTITLPTHQTGIYLDPRYPMFKVYVYKDEEGFDLLDVHKYYGGAELVPEEIKRKYVDNRLTYDIRTVVGAIQKEYRQLMAAGRV